MTFLPTAAEVLIVGSDPMIQLPIHFELKNKILVDRLPTMIEGFEIEILSRSDLIIESELQLRSILTDFKQYFEINYLSIPLGSESISFSTDCQKASRYLFIRLSDFKRFLSGDYSLDWIIDRVLEVHVSLIDLTLKNLEIHRVFSDYLSDLESLAIPEDAYLTWIASLPRSVSTLVFRAVCLSLLKYDMPLL